MIKNKSLIVAVLILIVLGAIYALQQQSKERQVKTADEGFTNLTADVNIDRIVEIRAWIGEEAQPAPVHLKKQEGDWVAPNEFSAPVDRTKIEALLNDLRDLEGRLRSESEAVLGDYDISDEAALHVSLLDDSGNVVTHLLFGKAGERMQNSFVRKAGSPRVYGISSNPRSRFNLYGQSKDLEITPWLDLKLVSAGSDQIQRLEIDDRYRHLVFEKQTVESDADTTAPPTTEWKLIEPPDYTVAESKFESYLNQLKNVSGERVVDPAKKAEYGLDEPSRRLTMQLEGDSELSILVGDAAPKGDNNYSGFYATTSDIDHVFVVRDYYVDSYLFKDASGLLDIPQLEIKKDQAQEIVIEHPDEILQLKKEEDTWTLVSPEMKGDLQKSRMDKLLNTLDALKPADIVTEEIEQEISAESNRGMFSVTSADGSVFEIYRGEALDGGGDTVPVRFNNMDGLFTLKQSDVRSLFPTSGNLLDLKVVTLARNEIKGIQLESSEGDKRILTKEGDKWVCSTPEETFEVDTDPINVFLGRLASLQLEKVKAEAAQIENGDTFIVSDGNQTETIVIGSTKEDDTAVISMNGKRHAIVSAAQRDRLLQAYHALFEVEKAETEDASAVSTGTEDSISTGSMPANE